MMLVTGATGLVGSEFCKLLSSSNIEYRGLKRINSDTSLCGELEIEWCIGNVLDVTSLDEAMQGVHVVVHCAAIVSFDSKNTEEMMRVNILGTQNVVNSCLENNVDNLVHVSSVAALGRIKESSQITEDTLWEESPLNTDYAKSKYLSEVEVWRGESEGLNVAVVNPSVILAPGDGNRSSSKLLQYIWDEHKFYIDKQLNFVDVRDVAKAILKIYKESAWGEKYILNRDSIMYESLFVKLANKLAKKPPSKRVSIKYLIIGVTLSKIWSFVSNRPQLISSELMKSMKENFSYSSDKICNELQFEFRDSDATFDWVCEEFVKMKNVI